MNARSKAPPQPLKAASSVGFRDWVRGFFVRTVRAQVIAKASVHLGEPLDVEWRLDCAGHAITNVHVTLIGTEIARQRISARTGISVVTEKSPFRTMKIDTRVVARGATQAEGRGSVVLATSSVPTLVGKLNEVAWAVVIEAVLEGAPLWRDEFPIVVLAALSVPP